MRINKVIPKGKILWSFDKFCLLIFQGLEGDQSGEFARGYWGREG